MHHNEYIQAVLVKARNGLFLVDPHDMEVGHKLRETGNYGQRELDYIIPLINAKSDVLVIGAHLGSLAIPIAKIVKHVDAIEANPETFNLLKMNILLNDSYNCSAKNIAANDKQQDIKFLLNTVNSGGSKRRPVIENSMYTYDNPKEILVEGVPLDNVLKTRNYDLILMDIEGSEYFALKGMPEILQKSKVLIMEFIPHHLRNVSAVKPDDILKLLKEFKFLTIPTKGVRVPKKDFSFVLNHMFDNDLSDDGIIFEKN